MVARPRVLVVNGSSRTYGNTAKMALVAAEAARRYGAEARVIHLALHRIEPCRACYSDDPLECGYPKKCPLYDGTLDSFKRIAEDMLESDAVVIATPVYWFNASGLVKNLIDRMTSLENMVYHVGHSLLDGKIGGGLAAGEEAGAAMALSWLALTLNMMGLHLPPWSLAYYHGKGDVLEDEQAVLDSYNVGRSVVLAALMARGEKPEEAAPGRWYVRPPRSVIDEIISRVREETGRLKRAEEKRRPWLRGKS